MKKYSILVAAFAMLAFAGCNKEHDGMVALNFGGEEYMTNDKQAYQDNAILFTTGDQAYINGTVYELTPYDQAKKAKVWVSSSDGSYEVHYPESSVYYDAENEEWKTIFASAVDLIPAAAYTTITGNGYPVWPMSGYVEDITAQEAGYMFKLYNNVAIMSPGVTYGYAFAEAMWGANGIDPQGYTYSTGNIPQMTITKVVIASDDVKLTGTATLANPRATDEDIANYISEPYFEMDDVPAGTDSIVCTVANGGYHPTANEAGADAVITTYFGNLPLAPVTVNGIEFTMTYYFNVTFGGVTRYYKYTNTFTTNPQFHFARSYRSTVNANFNNPNVTNLRNKITVRANPFGETML